MGTDRRCYQVGGGESAAWIDAERKAREERRRREEEEKKRVEEEEKRKADEARRKMAEETKRRILEEEERKKKEEADAKRFISERFQAEEKGRNLLGLTMPEEDWANARNTLLVRNIYL